MCGDRTDGDGKSPLQSLVGKLIATDFTTIGADAVSELTTGFALSSLYQACPRGMPPSIFGGLWKLLDLLMIRRRVYRRLEVIDFLLVVGGIFRSDRERVTSVTDLCFWVACAPHRRKFVAEIRKPACAGG
jgi:hypothetical protein